MSRVKKALEKAKEARRIDGDTLFEKSESTHTITKSHEEKRQKYRHNIHVTYSKTKVVNVEPRIFRKNKIVSLFYEDKMADQMKTLRTQVLNKLEALRGNSLLVTSANPGEGKTFTAINLGVSIAQELDRTVLLVDADLRHPPIHHYDFAKDFFGLDVTKGLSHYLVGEVEIPDILLNPGIQRFTILPSGQALPNSAEALGSPRMESLVIELKNHYRDDRIIIFDTPAVLVCADAAVLSRFVDGVLLVVEAEETSPSDLKRVMELLEHRPIVGSLLNKAKGQRN
jgi:protein-tyrosine kinase